MPAIYQNFVGGLVDNNPLSNVGTTLTSTALANLATIASPDYAWLVLDPDGGAGAPEVVKVTTHTAAATSATIERAQQGTTARQHNQNEQWIVAWTRDDARDLVRSVTVQTYTAGNTWNKPTNLIGVMVEVQGGGGGGGGAQATTASQYSFGSGGAAGGYARKWIPAASLASTVTVTIGAAGSGGSGANNGGNGGTTSFGAHVSASGGQGGGHRPAAATASVSDASGTQSLPGVGSNGDVNGSGQPGTMGAMHPTVTGVSGAGGNSFYGYGAPAKGPSAAGTAAFGNGAGGSGAINAISQSARAGGAGTVGMVIVTEFRS